MHLHVVRQGPLKHRMEKESKKSVTHKSEEGRQAEGHENLLKKKVKGNESGKRGNMESEQTGGREENNRQVLIFLQR